MATTAGGSYYPDAATAASQATWGAAMASAEEARFLALASTLTPKAVADHTLVTHLAGLIVLNTTTGLLYQSNGSTWQRIVLGDTGWVTLQAATASVPLIQYRKVGETVTVYTSGTYASGMANATNTTLLAASIPAAARPMASMDGLCRLNNIPQADLIINAAGDVTIRNLTGSPQTVITSGQTTYLAA